MVLVLTKGQGAAVIRAARKGKARVVVAGPQGAGTLPSEDEVRPRMKYKNHRVTVDGIKFDSQAEADRYAQLVRMEQAGVIDNLKRQVRMALNINGSVIGHYVADFQYEILDDRGHVLRVVTEDVKGMATPLYLYKRKLIRALYRIEIAEIPSRKVKEWEGRIP